MWIGDSIAFAHTQVGKPYDSSAANRMGPNAYDCSGLVSVSLWHGGMPHDAFPTNSAGMTQHLVAHPELRLSRTQAAHTLGGILLKGGINGYGPAGHVGFSLGDGIHTIEARGHGGVNVYQLTDIQWDDFMLAPAISYTPPAPAPAPAPVPPTPTMKETTMLLLRGDTTPHVWLYNGGQAIHLTGDKPGTPGTYGAWLMFCVANVPGSVDPKTKREWVVPQRMVDAIPKVPA